MSIYIYIHIYIYMFVCIVGFPYNQKGLKVANPVPNSKEWWLCVVLRVLEDFPSLVSTDSETLLVCSAGSS